MIAPAVTALRSLLFSPGSRADMMEKAKRSGADGLIFDLEDAVAPGQRSAAREQVAAALSGGDGPPVFVRVNHPSTGEMERDLDAVVTDGLFGVVLPKAETAAEVAGLDEALGVREERAGLGPGSVVVLPLVESCRGVHFAYHIASASPRVAGLAFSSGEEGDFMADLDGQWTPTGEAMLYPRSKLLCEARAAGLEWAVDGVFMNLGDDDALLAECRLARRLGYGAKMAIHPRQVPVIHEVFTPTAEEVAFSEGLLAAFERAQASGTGAFRYEGMMVDKANVRRANRVLARAALSDGPGTPS
ncbi:MAG: CoA ester lyase [Propionibacteriales bacterium]|nr:CoA ester lyase [Propionibacteriales bacterium]